jgi:hypothetical protein
MSHVDPPSNNENENDCRLLSSIYAMTLREVLSSHDIDPYMV